MAPASIVVLFFSPSKLSCSIILASLASTICLVYGGLVYNSGAGGADLSVQESEDTCKSLLLAQGLELERLAFHPADYLGNERNLLIGLSFPELDAICEAWRKAGQLNKENNIETPHLDYVGSVIFLLHTMESDYYRKYLLDFASTKRHENLVFILLMPAFVLPQKACKQVVEYYPLFRDERIIRKATEMSCQIAYPYRQVIPFEMLKDFFNNNAGRNWWRMMQIGASNFTLTDSLESFKEYEITLIKSSYGLCRDVCTSSAGHPAAPRMYEHYRCDKAWFSKGSKCDYPQLFVDVGSFESYEEGKCLKEKPSKEILNSAMNHRRDDILGKLLDVFPDVLDKELFLMSLEIGAKSTIRLIAQRLKSKTGSLSIKSEARSDLEHEIKRVYPGVVCDREILDYIYDIFSLEISVNLNDLITEGCPVWSKLDDSSTVSKDSIQLAVKRGHLSSLTFLRENGLLVHSNAREFIADGNLILHVIDYFINELEFSSPLFWRAASITYMIEEDYEPLLDRIIHHKERLPLEESVFKSSITNGNDKIFSLLAPHHEVPFLAGFIDSARKGHGRILFEYSKLRRTNSHSYLVQNVIDGVLTSKVDPRLSLKFLTEVEETGLVKVDQQYVNSSFKHNVVLPLYYAAMLKHPPLFPSQDAIDDPILQSRSDEESGDFMQDFKLTFSVVVIKDAILAADDAYKLFVLQRYDNQGVLPDLSASIKSDIGKELFQRSNPLGMQFLCQSCYGKYKFNPDPADIDSYFTNKSIKPDQKKQMATILAEYCGIYRSAFLPYTQQMHRNLY